GAWSGKNFSTGSSRLSLPSAIASPTAVELKLLLSECSTCGLSGASGFHHPSAITWPWRTSMKLCSVSILSTVKTKSRIACEEMPWVSGVLRGSDWLPPVAEKEMSEIASADGSQRRLHDCRLKRCKWGPRSACHATVSKADAPNHFPSALSRKEPSVPPALTFGVRHSFRRWWERTRPLVPLAGLLWLAAQA